jgi:hypothetical protein
VGWPVAKTVLSNIVPRQYAVAVADIVSGRTLAQWCADAGQPTDAEDPEQQALAAATLCVVAVTRWLRSGLQIVIERR